MRWWTASVAVASILGSAACATDEILVPVGGAPDAPLALDVTYYNQAVSVTWELSNRWEGEPFRVYAREAGLGDYLFIAEVTNCADGFCSYTDTNIISGATYDYYVTAVGFDGVETASFDVIRITIPSFLPPPSPMLLDVVSLDNANYLRWDESALSVSDFSFYRVYLVFDGTSFLLGETDSQGFLDELAENGLTYEYYVTALDEYGHESAPSGSAIGTPRPDYNNEVLYDYFAIPGVSGFIFQDDEGFDPVVDGDDPLRHFRLETDAQGWWLVPGPGVSVYPVGFETSELKCGPGSDADCVDLPVAPQGGYQAVDVNIQPQTSYVLQVPGGDNLLRYAVVRAELLGFDEQGDPLMIFDWAYQLQVGNPSLSPARKVETRIRGR